MFACMFVFRASMIVTVIVLLRSEFLLLQRLGRKSQLRDHDFVLLVETGNPDKERSYPDIYQMGHFGGHHNDP